MISIEQNPFECINIEITDDIAKNAKIAAYMLDQQLNTPEGKTEPYAPKKFPEKAIDVMIPYNNAWIEIYLDTESRMWNSKFVVDGRFGKLSPEQMKQFFNTQTFAKIVEMIQKKWPLEDPFYSKLFDSTIHKQICSTISQYDIDEMHECDSLNEVDQAGKRPDLANKDITGDGKRDYSGSGRQIIHFGDMGVKGNSEMYFCWPRKGKAFKWNTWKDWTKIKPFARMTFTYNGRDYMISLSTSAEELDNRGFRGADLTWTPPLAWLTPAECEEVMRLSVVQKFLKKCIIRVKPLLDMKPEEVYARIDKPDKVDVKEIEKTQRVLRHMINTIFKNHQADNYRYD